MKGFLGLFFILAQATAERLPREPTKPARDEGEGHRPPKIYKLPQHHLAFRTPTEKNLPRDFTWANVSGRNWLTPSWNQHIPKYCGGCYLHSTLSALNDRFNIAKKGMGNQVMLARQTFVNCGPGRDYGNGCGGGGVHEVLGYMFDYGLPDESCQIWRAENGKCDEQGQCQNCFPADNGTSNCWPVAPFTTYRVKGYNLIDVKEPKDRAPAIMSEIMRRGPVTCGIYTSDLFDFNYYGGVWTSENAEFDHDIEVVGWGTDNGVDYWHIRNSWGTYWGEEGFLRIKRGLERGVVEYDCWFGIPDFSAEAQLYPKGKMAGSMIGLIDRTKMVVNVEEQKPLAEPQPPISVHIDVDAAGIRSVALPDSTVAVALIRPALWLCLAIIVVALGLYLALILPKRDWKGYDPIV